MRLQSFCDFTFLLRKIEEVEILTDQAVIRPRTTTGQNRDVIVLDFQHDFYFPHIVERK